MEKILQNVIMDELGKLRYNEVMYEGEVYHLAEKCCYDYNQLNVNLKDLIDSIYGRIYGSKDTVRSKVR